jgi:hypothetical protein
MRRMAGSLLLCCSLSQIAGWAAPARNQIMLPIEVAGAAGTVAAVSFTVPSDAGRQVRSLWMQVHGLGYAGMLSVRINKNDWVSISNSTVSVAEPGRSYGGIGGGFATLEMTLILPATAVVDDTNTIEFRFNGTNGISSAFRVLAFNLLTAGGRRVLSPDAFIEDDPNTWAPPLPDPRQISAGRSLWQSAQLVANGLPQASPLRAHCSDCHARDGRDLKYFNFSNSSIVARSRFHGLSELEGRQIASYIRSLTVPNPGRPWNPPYQPGPGLDSQPALNWAAGAGLSWVLHKDTDTLSFLFGTGNTGELLISPTAFRPDGNLNARKIPIAFQLPDWNHWLPRVHPLDAWGARFDRSTFARMYADSDYAKIVDAKGLSAFFDTWVKSRSSFLTPHLTSDSPQWTPELGSAFYSAQLWQLVKTWEIMQRFNYGAGNESRSWLNAIPAATAPAEVHIPNGPSGMGGSALTNEYYSNAWYEVQLLVNSGNHRHHDRSPVDWVYVMERFLNLQQQSGQPEPARVLVAVIKAMQSTDPWIGPGNFAEGWRPDQTVDPRIMVSKRWAAVFQTLPGDVRAAVTQSLLTAWLDKTLQYPPANYFQRGVPAHYYELPADFLDISGGKVWEAAPQFLAAGVDVSTTRRLQAWGKAYTALAELFHY